MSRRLGPLPCAALLVGLAWSAFAPAQPSEEQAAAPSRLPSVATLKSEYVQCEQVSSQRKLSMHGAAYCSAVAEQLLKRGFDGDLDRLLAWWRAERATPTASVTR
jgi:hypothetical protein